MGVSSVICVKLDHPTRIKTLPKLIIPSEFLQALQLNIKKWHRVHRFRAEMCWVSTDCNSCITWNTPEFLPLVSGHHGISVPSHPSVPVLTLANCLSLLLMWQVALECLFEYGTLESMVAQVPALLQPSLPAAQGGSYDTCDESLCKNRFNLCQWAKPTLPIRTWERRQVAGIA